MAALVLRMDKYPAILHIDRDSSEKKFKCNVGLEEIVAFARLEIYLGCKMEESSKPLGDGM